LQILQKARSAQRNKIILFMRKILIVWIFLFPLFGVGCFSSTAYKTKEAATWGAQKAGDIIKQSGTGYVRNLTEEQVVAIGEWLKANNLNEYGDPLDTVYAGGNPLFDEFTGETKDRFEYLFKKFPNLKDIIENYQR